MNTRSLAIFAIAPLAAVALGITQEPEMAKPGPEHETLKMDEGTWTATVKFWTAPDAPPQEAKGTEVNKLTLDGFWMVSDVTEDGGPYRAHAIVGYDTMKKKYVHSSVDNMMPVLHLMEGSFDKSKKTFTWTGEGPDMMGTMVKKRTVVTYPDANTRMVVAYSTGADGKETKSMEIAYKRK
ncbi:MAG: DUF1579 domain-containing protein [Planctomycetota bacterium]|nr:MAG: DUF1579 domain-containing protein [Planctomycetota bacterium]